MVNIPENVNKIFVHTGNILNLNEVKKNAGQNSSEEVSHISMFYECTDIKLSVCFNWYIIKSKI